MNQVHRQYLAGIIATLVLGVVIIAGCTSPTPSPTPSVATSTSGARDAFLDKFVTSMESELKNNTTVSVWVSKWQNGSVVTIQTTFKNVTSNQDITLNRTVMRFASTEDASNYAASNYPNALETTNFTKLTSLPYKAYQATKGSAPTVYRAWTQVLRLTTIQQLDNILVIDSVSASSSATTTTSQ